MGKKKLHPLFIRKMRIAQLRRFKKAVTILPR